MFCVQAMAFSWTHSRSATNKVEIKDYSMECTLGLVSSVKNLFCM